MHLTNNESSPHSCAVASDFSEAAGAPANDIEITAEMMAKGIQAFLCNRGMEYETEEEVVWLILKATFGPRVKFVGVVGL